MKVLVAPVATRDADGTPNSLAVEGELLIDPGTCPCDDPECDGDYVFLGVASGQPSLEAIVADMPILDPREFRTMVREGCCAECATNGNADFMVNRSRFTANSWPVGSVLVRREGVALARTLGRGR